MGEKEQGATTAGEAGSVAAGAEDESSEALARGKPSKEQRVKAGLETTGGMLATGASRGSDEGDSEDAARLSTNMTIERQTPKRDFGD